MRYFEISLLLKNGDTTWWYTQCRDYQEAAENGIQTVQCRKDGSRLQGILIMPEGYNPHRA